MLKLKSDFINYVPFIFMWIIVICPKLAQLGILVCIAVVLFLSRKIKFNHVSVALMLIGGIHLFSSFYNFIIYQHLPERLFAAINLALVWIIAGLYYAYYSNIESINYRRISKICGINIMIMALLILPYFVLSKMNVYEFAIGPNSLITTDYINGAKTVRFVGLMEYSNLVPSFLMINLIGFYTGNKNKLLAIVLTLLSIAPIYLCSSRAAILVYLACVCLYIVFRKNNLVKWQYYILLISLFVLGIVFVIMSGIHVEIYNMIMDLVYMREGSNNTRLGIYLNSLTLTFERNPFIGVGIKDYVNGFPLGSHCTYIGILYKTGIIGLLIWCFILSVLLSQVVKSRGHLFIKFLFLGFVVFFLVEDIDGANWLIVMLFTMIAIFLKEKKKENIANE